MRVMQKTENTLVIYVNGSKREAPTGATLQDLIQTFGLERKKVVIELNHQVVHRSLYSDAVLSEGDTVEIVHFVGGG